MVIDRAGRNVQNIKISLIGAYSDVFLFMNENIIQIHFESLKSLKNSIPFLKYIFYTSSKILQEIVSAYIYRINVFKKNSLFIF